MNIKIDKHAEVYREGVIEDGYCLMTNIPGTNTWLCTRLTFSELIQLRDALDEVIEEELSDPSNIERL